MRNFLYYDITFDVDKSLKQMATDIQDTDSTKDAAHLLKNPLVVLNNVCSLDICSLPSLDCSLLLDNAETISFDPFEGN